MFALVESSRTVAFGDGWAGRAGSFAIHAGLIWAAVVLTRQVQRAEPSGIAVVPVRWYRPTPPHPAPPDRRPVTPPAPHPAPAIVLPDRIQPDSATPNVPAAPAPGPGAGRDTAAATGGTPGDSVGAYHGDPLPASGVDELPVLLAHPPLRYPEVLRQAGIQGRVTVEAVLDTLGRVERGSVVVIGGDNELFAADARAVVAGSVYRPARLAGRVVRVRIQIPIVYAIRR